MSFLTADNKDSFQNLREFIANSLVKEASDIDFSQYDDPVKFGEEVLGEWYTEDVKELMRSVRDNRATIARSSNGVGKSHAAARIALWFFFRYPDSQVYTAAAPPENNLRMILWGELGRLIETYKHLFKNFKVNDLNVKRHGKSFLTGVTIPSAGTPAQREGKFSGKHAPQMLFICDEADSIPPEVFKGIESCMSGGEIVRLLCMFNPRHESGHLYNLEKKRLANVVELTAFRHPNVVTGENLISGAVDRPTTLRRIQEWTRELKDGEKVDSECFEVPDFLVGCESFALSGERHAELKAGWRKIVEPAFSYMVLGQYPAASDGQLISRSLINNARARYDLYVATYGEVPPKNVRPIQGIDVAEKGNDSNVSCLRYGSWVAPLEAWNGIDTLQTADTATDIYHQARALRACVDGTGVGAGVAPQMERNSCEAYGVMVANSPTFEVEEGIFYRLRDQLWWMCREWLRTDTGAMLPDDEELIEELTTPTYDVKGGEIHIMKKDDMKLKLGRSPDKADALVLTFYNEVIEPESATGALAHALLKHRGQ